MNTAPKQPFTVILTPETRAQLDRLATKQERSRSWIAATAIREYMAKVEAEQKAAPR